jgi:hypothetical protein
MKHIFEFASGFTALIAAGLWFWSAAGRIPDLLDTPMSGEGSITDLMSRQSRRSAFAALAAGISALAQVAATFSN